MGSDVGLAGPAEEEDTTKEDKVAAIVELTSAVVEESATAEREVTAVEGLTAAAG